MKIIYFLFIIVFFVLLISISEQEKEREEIIFEEGNYFFKEDLIIEENELLKLMPGVTFKFSEGKRLLVKGKIFAKGSEKNPVVFMSGGDYFWGGVLIQGKEDYPNLKSSWEWLTKGDGEVDKYFFEKISNGNILKHCHFFNISNENNFLSEKSRWRGAVEARNTNLYLSNSLFGNIEHVGGVVTKGTYGIIKENVFLPSKIHKQINSSGKSVVLIYNNEINNEKNEAQGCADGIWIVDSVAFIYLNKIKNAADDGIGVIRSYSFIANNNIYNAADDGIDIEAGISRESIIYKNYIESVSEHGIKITGSNAVVVENNVVSSFAGISLRDGSSVLVKKNQLEGNEEGFLIYNSIPCFIAKIDFLRIKSKILDINSNCGFCKICKAGVCFADSIPLEREELLFILKENYTKEDGIYYYNKDYKDRVVRQIFARIIKDKINYSLLEKNIEHKCFDSENTLVVNEDEEIEASTLNNYSLDYNIYNCGVEDIDGLCRFQTNQLALKLDNIIKRLAK